jgi:membrane associated rhomboid family serine protease
MAGPDLLIPAIGASGAVAGVLGVYLILYPTAPVRVFIPGLVFTRLRRVPAALVLGLWFVLQLFNGFLTLGSGDMATGGVAWFAHIGGFVVGLLVGIVLRVFRNRDRRQDYRRY